MTNNSKNINSQISQTENISQVDLRVIRNAPIIVINCSYPYYNLAIEKVKGYASKAVQVRSLDDFFTPEYEAVFLSAIFSWDVPFLIKQGRIALEAGKKIFVGGGGSFYLKNLIRKELGAIVYYEFIEVEGKQQKVYYSTELDKIKGNYNAIYFTRGCVENCSFCIVPKIEGNIVTFVENAEPAPLLLDNNLSEIKWEFKERIVEKYLSSGIKKVDANSGFEPKGIDAETVKLFNQLPLISWRVGFDEIAEEKQWEESIKVIKEFSKKPIRVYSMIGKEPIEQCRYRCEKIISMGCEPVPQAYIALDALRKEPKIMHDWTLEKLKHFQRFFYRAALWRGRTLEQYDQWRRIAV